MSRIRLAPRTLAVGAGLAVLLPLTACGAGTKAETNNEQTTIQGLNTASGVLLIRDFTASSEEVPGNLK